MKRALPPLGLACSLALVVAYGAPPEDYPSEVSRVLATFAPETGEGAGAAERAAAARAFLGGLSDELRAQAALDYEDGERRVWTNTPPRGPQGGVRLGDLSEEQLQAACTLLAHALSPEGYTKTRDILLGDDLLLAGGRPRAGFGAENFWLAVFGEPDAEGAWALQLDGHHLALNLSFHGDALSMSPSFLGAQPSSYERGGERIEPLAEEVAAAFELMGSLTTAQSAQAQLGPRRGRIAAGAGRDGVIPDPTGLPCSELNEAQRALLLALVSEHIDAMPAPAVRARLAAVEAELDELVFAWNGPTVGPSDVSYRVQGPSVLIEYACQDLGGDPLDHLHAMVRNPANEYGVALGED